MTTNPPLVDPKIEAPHELCEEEDAILEPTFPMIIGFHIEMGRYVCWNKRNTMLISHIQYAAD